MNLIIKGTVISFPLINNFSEYLATGVDRTANNVYAMAGIQEAVLVSTPRPSNSSIITPRDFSVPFTRQFIKTVDNKTLYKTILMAQFQSNYQNPPLSLFNIS